MDGPRVCQLSKVKFDREGEISCGIPYILNLKRNDTKELTYKIGRDLENELMIARVKGE